MLQVYNRNAYVSVNGEDWYCIDSTNVLRDDTQQAEEEFIMDELTFEQCKDFLWNRSGRLYGVHLENNLLGFGKKLLVAVQYHRDNVERYRNFKTISYKYVYTKVKNVTLKEIVEGFPAEQCIQYLKERGMECLSYCGR